MKYEKVIYIKDGNKEEIIVKDYLVSKLEEMEKVGDFFCSGKDCEAKLCLVHNTRNGGRTCFLKVIDDAKHHPNCEFKIDNYKETSIRVRRDGIYTEKQVNDAVRRIYNDYTKPVNAEEKKKDKPKKKTESRKKADDSSASKSVASGGRIIFGDEEGEGVPGRMCRRYEVTTSDVGIMTTVCGVIKSAEFEENGEFVVRFSENRLENIKVVLGSIYQHNNLNEFKNLYLFKDYYDNINHKKSVRVAAGGLVNLRNEQLILEVQANGALRMDGKTVMQMAVEKAKNKFTN